MRHLLLHLLPPAQRVLVICDPVTLRCRYESAVSDYTTPAIMHHRAIEKQILASAAAAEEDDAPVGADTAAKARQIEAAKSSMITQALQTHPPHRTPSQVNYICNSLLSNAFFKMQPTPLQPDIAAHLVLLDVPAGEIAISEVDIPLLLRLPALSCLPRSFSPVDFADAYTGC